jgi:hypothetical protein
MHLPDLRRADDAYQCLRGEGVKERYLPREQKEPPKAYATRLNLSVFPDFFRPAINGVVGVLGKFTLQDLPPSFEQAMQNIDLEGNAITPWLGKADSWMLANGGCYIHVEMPGGEVDSAADEAAADRRPYLLLRRRSRCINWWAEIVDGVERLRRCTFLEMSERHSADSYGMEIVPQYRVITAAGWKLLEMKQDDKGKWQVEEVGDGKYLRARQAGPLSRPPVVWYPSELAGFGQGELPLRQVVEHSFEYFQQGSDLREKTRKCAMPVPVIKGRQQVAPPIGAPEGWQQPPLELGPNSAVELEDSATSSFNWSEPSAASLAEQRAQIGDVKDLIDQQTLGFLYGDGGSAKTAKQVTMEGAQVEGVITRLTTQKASAFQSILEIWCEFTGETLSPDAGLTMAASVFERPLEPADVMQIQSLTGGAQLLSQQSGIEELQRGGRIRVTTTAEDELQRIQAEQPEPADDVGLNDLGGLA